MALSDKTMTDFRLCLESMRSYLDTTTKALAAGTAVDAADIQSNLALCKGQVEAIAGKMDADSPAIAADVSAKMVTLGITPKGK